LTAAVISSSLSAEYVELCFHFVLDSCLFEILLGIIITMQAFHVIITLAIAIVTLFYFSSS
jgi:hypothetical protein